MVEVSSSSLLMPTKYLESPNLTIGAFLTLSLVTNPLIKRVLLRYAANISDGQAFDAFRRIMWISVFFNNKTVETTVKEI